VSTINIKKILLTFLTSSAFAAFLFLRDKKASQAWQGERKINKQGKDR
jgi:hypothetical protein